MIAIKNGRLVLPDRVQDGKILVLVDDRIRGLNAGADDYLTKPFAMGESRHPLRPHRAVHPAPAHGPVRL